MAEESEVEHRLEAGLKERLKEQSELVNYAKDILGLLNSDDLLKKSKNVCERIDLVNSKLDKGKESTTNTIRTLERNKLDMEQAILEDYRKVMEDASTASSSPAPQQPSIQAVKDEMRRVHARSREMERDLKKLEAEKRIIQFHKKQYKLMKKIADVQFDTSSTDKHIKGYLHKSDGRYMTFEFDLTKESPSAVADFLWDNV